MKPIVLDCSATISWCFKDEVTEYTDRALDYVRKNSAIVPPLWMSEITNVLRSAVMAKRMDMDGSLLFLEKIAKLPIRIATLSSKEYFADIFVLACQEKLTTYDATYLYLAKREKCSLVTLDDELKKASRRLKLPKLN